MQSKYSKEARIVASGIFGGHDMAALYDCNKYNYTYKYNLQFAMAADLVLRSRETHEMIPQSSQLAVAGFKQLSEH